MVLLTAVTICTLPGARAAQDELCERHLVSQVVQGTVLLTCLRGARSDLGARSDSDVDGVEIESCPTQPRDTKKSCRDQLSSPVKQSTTVRSCCDGATTTAFLLKRPIPLSFLEEDSHNSHYGPRYAIRFQDSGTIPQLLMQNCSYTIRGRAAPGRRRVARRLRPRIIDTAASLFVGQERLPLRGRRWRDTFSDTGAPVRAPRARDGRVFWRQRRRGLHGRRGPQGGKV